jgi:TMEM175 potassium channel family protein
MHKGRFEAFTDAVIAIIMTVMVLELKPPSDQGLGAIVHEIGPSLLGYLLSFAFLGIYWNNHHHMMQAAKHVNGVVLWANLHLLFWLSLIPFATEWMDVRTPLTPWPVAFYGADLFCCGVAYFLLSRALVAANRQVPEFEKALGRDFKGRISVVIYAVAIVTALFSPIAACALYAGVALMWIVPDRRFEREVDEA